MSLKTSEVENFGVAFELTLDAQAASSVNFQVLLDGLPIGVTLPGQTGMPKPVSLEIGIHKITCVFKDMQQAGVFFTSAITIVIQKMPTVRYLAPFTVSLLTERIGIGSPTMTMSTPKVTGLVTLVRRRRRKYLQLGKPSAKFKSWRGK